MQQTPTPKPVDLHCPECGRWQAEVTDYGRVVCRDCGCELRYYSRSRRLLTMPAKRLRIKPTE